jgi:hypothetical protein
MDISEAVTEFHKMKRGNYAVSDSDYTWNDAANSSTSPSVITRTYIREEVVRSHGQKGTSEVGANTSHNQQARGSVCNSHCIQGEPIQRGLLQQVEWSAWSMAITLGQTRVVATQTNGGSTQVCATSIRHLVRSVQVPSGKELVLGYEPTRIS